MHTRLSNLRSNHFSLPEYILFFPRWTGDSGPICPRVTSVHFLEESETDEGDISIARWTSGLALITPPPTSVGIFNWAVADDALKWLCEEESPQARSVASFQITQQHEHPTYAKLSALPRLTLQGPISPADWENLAAGCPLLQELNLTVYLEDDEYLEDNETPELSLVTLPALHTFSIAFTYPHDHCNREVLRICLFCTDLPALRSFKLSGYGWEPEEVVEVGQRLAEMKALENFEMIARNGQALQNIVPHLPPLVKFSFGATPDVIYGVEEVWEVLDRRQTRLKELVIKQICDEHNNYMHGGTCTRMALDNLARNPNTNLERLVTSFRMSPNERFDGPITPIISLRSLTLQYLSLYLGAETAFTTFLQRRWYTKELKALRQGYAHLARKEFAARNKVGWPAALVARNTARNTYNAALVKAKTEHWDNFLEDISESDIWTAGKYATREFSDGSKTHIPSLVKKHADGSQTTASTDDDKCQLLQETFFPPRPIDLPPTPQDFNPIPKPLDFTEPTQHRIRKRIQRLRPYKAPGPNGIPNVVFMKCADVLAPMLHRILLSSIRCRYFPMLWRTWKTVVLRKPKRPDYTVAKAYRPIASTTPTGRFALELWPTSRLSSLCATL